MRRHGARYNGKGNGSAITIRIRIRIRIRTGTGKARVPHTKAPRFASKAMQGRRSSLSFPDRDQENTKDLVLFLSSLQELGSVSLASELRELSAFVREIWVPSVNSAASV